MAIIKAASTGKGSVKHVLDYVTRKEKTDMRLCTGINCSADTAFREMQLTKELFHKTGGRTFLHFVQSFSPDEKITPEEAHQIAFELAENFTHFHGHEVLIATHCDRQHIHSHFVVNSVSYEDGKKFQMDRKGLQRMKDLSDSICKKHGFSICEKGQKKSSLTSYDMDKYQLLQKAEQGKVKSYVLDTAVAVQESIEQAASKEDFIALMNQKGYTVNWTPTRKYVVFQDSNGRKVRNSNLEKTFGMPVSKEQLEQFFHDKSQQKEPAHQKRRR